METKNAIGKDLIINLNGVSLAYDDLGNGETPLIFIHGFPFSKSMWQAQMDILRRSQRVIAYDIRGYGRSTAGEEEQSIELFADDLINFMDALSIPKAVVCGFSMGGYTLLNAVSRYPDRFKALIFADTQCGADTPEGIEKRKTTIAMVKSGKINDFAESFLSAVFCKVSFETKLQEVQKARDIILNTSPLTIAGGLSALSRRGETCSVLGSISVPTLILCGKEDVVTPVAQAEFLNEEINDSQIHIFENAGHMSALEQAEEFNEQVLQFIGTLKIK